MKKIFFLSLLAICHNASAITVSISPTITVNGFHGNTGQSGQASVVSLKNSAGVLLPVGSQIRVGFFKGYTSALDAKLKNPAELRNLLSSGVTNEFVPLGELGNTNSPGLGDNTIATNDIKEIATVIRAQVSMTNISYQGSTDGSDANKTGLGGLGRGTKLFVFAFNNANVAQDFSAAGFEYGLFSASTWTAALSGSSTLTLRLEDVDTAGEVYWGSLGSLQTAAVPEPAFASLLVFGTLLGFRRRRA
jgi:hypothetical protein